MGSVDGYCARIEETKALVEPFPFVPAICIGRIGFRSDGYHAGVLSAISLHDGTESKLQSRVEEPYHISNFPQPF